MNLPGGAPARRRPFPHPEAGENHGITAKGVMSGALPQAGDLVLQKQMIKGLTAGALKY